MTRLPGDTRSLSRWEVALVVSLLGLSALAWVATDVLAAPDMRLGILTGASEMPADTMAGDPMAAGAPMAGQAMPGGPMAAGGSAAVAAAGLFVATWVVMMTAMMFPAIAPVVVTVDRWAVRTQRTRAATLLFVAGYLLVWGAAGIAAYGLMTRVMPLLPAGQAAVRAGAAVLVAAGLYEFTPLKEVCLRHCRSPLAFVAEHATRLRRGGLAGTKVGVIHGTFCLGCCWALMLVLVLLGMMSLAWMAAVAGVILLEKVLPRGWPVSRLVGAVLVTVGAVLLAWPQTLPVMA